MEKNRLKIFGEFVSTSLLLLTFFPSVAQAKTNAQTFTYQGRFLKPDGSAPLSDVVDVTFSIYDPLISCLLYEETQTNVDLTSTNGFFSLSVGSAFPSAKRTANDPHLTMSTVFSNATPILGAGGCSYSPIDGQSRKLRVTVTPHSTGVPTVLTPDQNINSVPQAQTAETLQGLSPEGFIQSASGVSGQANVSLNTLKTLTDGSDASSLHNHDSRYVQLGGANPTNLGGNGAFTNGDFDFGGDADRTIQVDRNSSAFDGSDLTIEAGGAKAGAADQNGGNLVLSSGISTGSGGSAIEFNTSSGSASGTNDVTANTKMVLTSNGRLGVGTTNPQAQLEVDVKETSIVGTIIKAITGQTHDLLQFLKSDGTILSSFDADGNLILPSASPTNPQQATTKQYVDDRVSAATVAGVSSFNTRTGNVTLTGSDVTGALTYTPLKNTTDTLTGTLTVTSDIHAGGVLGVGAVPVANTQFQSTSTLASSVSGIFKGASSQTADLLQFQNSSGSVLSSFDKNGYLTLPGDPTASLQAATKSYVDTAIASLPSSSITALTGDVSASGSGSVSATVNQVGGSTAANVHTAEVAANAATSANTANTIVKRDASGNFSAGTITATLNGASSLNVLKAGDTMSGPLKMHTATTADALAQILLATGATTNKGLVVQGQASQSADLTEWQNSAGSVLASVNASGKIWGSGFDAKSNKITNVATPTTDYDAATKKYVDDQVIAASGGGVTTFNTRNGAVTLTSGDVTGALTYTPLKNTTDTLTGTLTVTSDIHAGGAIGAGAAPAANVQLESTATAATRIPAVFKGASSQSADLLEFQNSSGSVLSSFDKSGYLTLPGNPTSSNQAATKAYVDSAISSIPTSGITALTGDVIASGPGSATATVAKVGGSTAANVHTAEVAANAATSTNTANTIVKRDASGNFSAGTITATLNGASSLNVLKAGDTMSGALKMHTATTADVLAQILLATGANTNKGLVIQSNSASQTANLTEWQDSDGQVIAKMAPSGLLTVTGLDASSKPIKNVFDPIDDQDAATKKYVDDQVTAASGGGVTTFNTRSGAVTLTSADVTGALTYTPLKNTTDTLTGTLTVTSAINSNGTIGAGGTAPPYVQFQSTAAGPAVVAGVFKQATGSVVDIAQFQNSSGAALASFNHLGMLTLPGDPIFSLQAATKGYVDTAVASSSGITALTGDVTASGSGSVAATVASVGGSTAANVHTAEVAANAATDANTFNTIVKRNSVGEFSASKINLSGASIGYGNVSSEYNMFPAGINLGAGANGDTTNIAFGNSALSNVSTGMYNTAIGNNSLMNTNGFSNVAIGYSALKTDLNGGNNIAIGLQALMNNYTGSDNVAIGYDALMGPANSFNNTFIGSGSNITGGASTASNNSFFGMKNIINNPATITSNTLLGYGNSIVDPSGSPSKDNFIAGHDNVLKSVTDGSTMIGFNNTSTNSASMFNYRNVIIGSNFNLDSMLLPSQGNLYLGTNDGVLVMHTDGAGANTTFDSTVKIGSAANPDPTHYKLWVDGIVASNNAFVNTSDARLKTDVHPLASSLEKLQGLQGVTYRWKDPKAMHNNREQIGFIAQDVEKVFPQAVTTSPSTGFKAVAYSMIIPPVVEAVKELYSKVLELFHHDDEQDRKIASLEDENTALRAQNQKLEERLDRIELQLQRK